LKAIELTNAENCLVEIRIYKGDKEHLTVKADFATLQSDGSELERLLRKVEFGEKVLVIFP